MDLKDSSFSDPLHRTFIPATRIVAGKKIKNTECLIGNKTLRGFVGCTFPRCQISPRGWILLDFGKELNGGVRIVTDGNMGECRIRLRFGESVSEAMGQPNMDHAIHDIELSIRGYSSADFGNTGFRFVRLDVLADSLQLHNVIAYSEERQLDQLGTFHSSDEELNQIFNTCVRTIKLNIQDYILDGIKRDRLVWAGDLHPEIAVILRVFGGISAIPETLELLRNHCESGAILNRHSSYSLWYLLVLREWWFYTGDRNLPALNEEFIKKIITTLEHYIRIDGSELLPPDRFLDWPSTNDENGLHAGLQALMILGFTAAEELLSMMGQNTKGIQQLIQRLRAHIPNPGTNKSAAALQHLAGMADRRDTLENNPLQGVSTFLGYYMLLAKENRRALALVKKYWGGMLQLGATSFWEDFNLDWMPNATRIDELPVHGRPDIHADFGAFCYKGLRHSLCHGWASGPAAWCSKRILGVNPVRPGFEVLRFTPDLCGLEYAEGTIPTPHGIVKVRLGTRKEPEIEVPNGIRIVRK